jgi:hypothetical protein
MKKSLIIKLVICLSIACSCNEPIEIAFVPEKPMVTMQEIDPAQDNHLMNLLTSLTNGKFKNGRSLETEFGEIDLSNAVKIINPFDTITRYTLRFMEENSFAFENLIIKENNQGVTSYILGYDPDANWMISRGGVFEKESFTGKLFIKSIDRTILSEATFKNGVGVDYKYYRNPNGRTNCDDTGSNDGGGGGNGEGGTGSGGDVGSWTGEGWEAGSSGGGGDNGGEGPVGEPCEWWISETTGWLIIDCPGLPLQVILRTACDPGGVPDYSQCHDSEVACIEDPIGILPPGGWPGSHDGLPLGWWLDEAWLDANFSLSPPEDYRDLTQAEKSLINLYPQAAYQIYLNKQKAFDMATERMGLSGGLNDKKDAFRHAFFNAMNERDCGDDQNLNSIAKKFADAHESEVPTELLKEKEMDLWNNEVGLNIGDVMFPVFISDESLADDVMEKILDGSLKYLSPLDFTASPRYDANHDGIQDCPTCLNGIVPTTLLIYTNQ